MPCEAGPSLPRASKNEPPMRGSLLHLCRQALKPPPPPFFSLPLCTITESLNERADIPWPEPRPIVTATQLPAFQYRGSSGATAAAADASAEKPWEVATASVLRDSVEHPCFAAAAAALANASASPGTVPSKSPSGGRSSSSFGKLEQVRARSAIDALALALFVRHELTMDFAHTEKIRKDALSTAGKLENPNPKMKEKTHGDLVKQWRGQFGTAFAQKMAASAMLRKTDLKNNPPALIALVRASTKIAASLLGSPGAAMALDRGQPSCPAGVDPASLLL